MVPLDRPIRIAQRDLSFGALRLTRYVRVRVIWSGKPGNQEQNAQDDQNEDDDAGYVHGIPNCWVRKSKFYDCRSIAVNVLRPAGVGRSLCVTRGWE